MTDETEVVPAAAVEKKKRKPRAKKVVTPEPEPVAKAPRAKAASSLPHEVRQDGCFITLSGSSVKLKVLTPAQQKEHGIKSIFGVMGKKCSTDVLKMEFKSRKAAQDFLTYSMEAGTDEAPKDEEFIQDGNKTEWYGERLDGMNY